MSENLKTLTADFNTLSVKKGELFAVNLLTERPASYDWHLKLKEGKASLVEEKHTPVSQHFPLTGGGTKHQWIYKAEEEGNVSIEAIHHPRYRRGRDLQRLTLLVKVEPDTPPAPVAPQQP